MKILLIAVNARYIHSNPAVFSLKACTGIYNSYVDIIEFTINQSPSYLLQDIYKKQPDVAAFSCYIWNRTILDAVIPDLHKILPKTDFWAGGPEVSYNAQEMIDRWQLRGVMTGPGEGSFSYLVSSYVNGTADSLPAVLDQTNTVRLPLNEIPFWYGGYEARDTTTGHTSNTKDAGTDNADNDIQREKDLADFTNRIIYYESSRGCPFSCSYCLSSIDKTMDFLPVERVCRELDFFLEQKVPQVKFTDRTFNCKKDHALPVLRHILEHDNGITNFHFEIAADLLDEEYFAVLKQLRPGAVQLEIGIQSTCPETIAAIDRKMDFVKVADVVRQISRWHNIHIHLDLIAGLPFEDLCTFRNSFNDVYALQPQQLQLGFLKVLKGSAMERRSLQYDLVYTGLPPYEVLSTKWLSYEDICRLKQVEEVLEIYYNSGQFTHTLAFLCGHFDTPFAMYESLAHWYEEHALFGIQSSRLKKYETILAFGAACIENKEQIEAYEKSRQISLLTEYVTYDLYLREHVKNRPSFAASLETWKDIIHGLLHREAEAHELFPQLADSGYRDLTKILHVEVFTSIFDTPRAVLFSYEKRDPLTNNCQTVHLDISRQSVLSIKK